MNYTFQFVNGTLTIGPALLTVTADNKNATEGNGLPDVHRHLHWLPERRQPVGAQRLARV